MVKYNTFPIYQECAAYDKGCLFCGQELQIVCNIGGVCIMGKWNPYVYYFDDTSFSKWKTGIRWSLENVKSLTVGSLTYKGSAVYHLFEERKTKLW